MNSLYSCSRRVIAWAKRCARSCECCVSQVVANDANAPIAEPARAAIADIYALSISPHNQYCRGSVPGRCKFTMAISAVENTLASEVHPQQRSRTAADL